MNTLFKVKYTAYFNLAYILSTNTVYGIRMLNETANRGGGPTYNLNGIFAALMLPWGILTVIGKSLLFGSLGPIGTGRILYSYYKYANTKDTKYLEVLHVPFSSFEKYNEKYIVTAQILKSIDNKLNTKNEL